MCPHPGVALPGPVSPPRLLCGWRMENPARLGFQQRGQDASPEQMVSEGRGPLRGPTDPTAPDWRWGSALEPLLGRPPPSLPWAAAVTTGSVSLGIWGLL